MTDDVRQMSQTEHDNEEEVTVARIGEYVRLRQGDDEVYIPYRETLRVRDEIREFTPGVQDL